MGDITDSEKYAFQEDAVKKRVREIVETELKNCEWDDQKVAGWIESICDAVMDELHSSRKPYKYAVTCALMQRTGAALHTSKAALWDGVTDGAITVTWPKRSNTSASSSIVCIVSVFAASFFVN